MIIYGCVMFASYFALIGKREKQKICPNAIYFLPCRFLYKKRQFSRNGFHGKFCFFRFRDKIKKKHYLIEVRQNPVNLSKGRKKKFFFSATGKEKRRKAYFLYVPSISLQCAISPPRPTLIVNFFFYFLLWKIEFGLWCFLNSLPRTPSPPPHFPSHKRNMKWEKLSRMWFWDENRYWNSPRLSALDFVWSTSLFFSDFFFYLFLFNFLYFNFHVFFFDVVLFPIFKKIRISSAVWFACNFERRRE